MKDFKHNVYIPRYVKDTWEEIEEKDSKKILLAEKSTGRSTVLNGVDAATKYNSIKMNFSLCSLGFEYSPDFLEHYYEVEVARKLLKRFPTIDFNHVKLVEVLAQEIKECLNKDIFIKEYSNIKRYYKTYELTGELMREFRRNEVKPTLLVIDDFNSIQASSKDAQFLLSSYFEMFDKTVIAADADKLDIILAKKKGYEVESVTYSKNFTFVQDIARFNLYNFNLSLIQNGQKQLPKELMSDSMIISLIERTNGNIDMMLKILYSFFMHVRYYEDVVDINLVIDKELNLTKYLETKSKRLFLK